VDGLKGFPEAIELMYPKAQVQLCILHMMRHSLNYVSWCQYRLKIPHSAGRKGCHPPEKMVYSFSRLIENGTGW
jgi:hypothetical protein